MYNTKTNNSHKILTVISIAILAFLLAIFTLNTNSFAQSAASTSSTSSASSIPVTTGSPVPVTGTGTAGNTISITFPDGSTATTIVKADGTYVLMPLKEQVAGSITITELSPTGVIVTSAKTIQYAGGTSSPVAMTPKLSIKDPYTCPGKIVGTVDNIKATVMVEILKAGTSVLKVPVTVNSDGVWSLDLTGKLADGTYTNKFTATFNGMIATGSYDFVHKTNCQSTSSSTIRTGGLNLFTSIASLSILVIGVYFLLINKFNRN